MRTRAIQLAIAAATIVGLMTIAAPAHADPCDVRVKDIIVIDLINCG